MILIDFRNKIDYFDMFTGSGEYYRALSTAGYTKAATSDRWLLFVYGSANLMLIAVKRPIIFSLKSLH